MLLIRKSQLEFIKNKVQVIDPAGRLTAEMARAYPDECTRIGEDGVCRRIDTAFRIAGTHDIKTLASIRRLAHVLFLLRVDALEDDASWIADILGWEDADESFRIAAIEKRTQQVIGGFD